MPNLSQRFLLNKKSEISSVNISLSSSSYSCQKLVRSEVSSKMALPGNSHILTLDARLLYVNKNFCHVVSTAWYEWNFTISLI